MTQRIVCVITHRQLHSGKCPWCHTDVQNSGFVPTRSDVIDWNLSQVRIDLTHKDVRVRDITTGNLDQEGVALWEAVTLLTLALNDVDQIVRAGATRTLLQIGRKCDNNEYIDSLAYDCIHQAECVLFLGYAFSRYLLSEEVRRKRCEVITTCVQYFPTSEVFGEPYGWLCSHKDVSAYLECKRLWIQHLQSQSRTAQVTANAAHFLRVHDKEYASQLRSELLPQSDATEE